MENPAARSARSEAPLVTVERSETGPRRPEAREPHTAWRYAVGMRLQVDREAESARSEAPFPSGAPCLHPLRAQRYPHCLKV